MKAIIISLILILLVSCGNREVPSDEKVNAFIKAANDAGENLVLAKQYTERGGQWVVFYNDQWYQGYRAYSLETFEIGMTWEDWVNSFHKKMTEYYNLTFDPNSSTLEKQKNHLKWIISPYHPYLLLTHDSENNLFKLTDGTPEEIYENLFFLLDREETLGKLRKIYVYSYDEDLSKDLEKMGSQLEEIEVSEMQEKLISYGLSTERAEDLGKMMVSYQKIRNKRTLTDREKDLFTQELTGMSFKRASEKLVNEGYESLIEKASEVNGVDPEALKEIVGDLM